MIIIVNNNNNINKNNNCPITSLNTSYKILTGLVEKYMRKHIAVNEIWDEGQLGAIEDVLGTVDQLIIGRCIMEEVKQAFYDYKKAYDKVHHDWMIRVYEWMKIIANIKISDVSLIKAINMVILVAAYAMNICRFNVSELNNLDQTIKRELRGKNMLGKQAHHVRLYLKREKRRRGLKLFRDTHKDTYKKACRLLHGQVYQSID